MIDPHQKQYHLELEAENVAGTVSQANVLPPLASQNVFFGQVIGRVVTINQANSFVVIEINAGRGAMVDQVLNVVRDQKQIAEVKVIQFRVKYIAADVQPGSNIGAIQIGDSVLTRR